MMATKFCFNRNNFLSSFFALLKAGFFDFNNLDKFFAISTIKILFANTFFGAILLDALLEPSFFIAKYMAKNL